MNVKHEQFIGIYENAFTKEYCDAVINYFEKMADAGFTLSRQEHENVVKSAKNDTILFSTSDPVVSLYENTALMRQFNGTLWGTCYPDYAEKYWILKDLGSHSSYSFKIQKTKIGQGYHLWHSDAGTRETCNRLLVWSLYLNDVEEGGETEFVHQHMRIKPKQGTLVIWPAGFTHTHRGNPPLTGDKYIVTGWIEF